MNPISSIPDNFYKLLILCGIALLVYSYSSYRNLNENFIQKTSPTLSLWDTIENNVKVVEFKNQKMVAFVKTTEERYGADSLFMNDGTNLIINEKKFKKITEQRVRDSSIELLKEFKEREFSLVLLPLHKFGTQRTAMIEQFDDLKDDIKYNSYILLVSVIILIIGLTGFLRQQIIYDRSQKTELLKAQNSSWCQSCGQLFSGINLHGRNNDGSANAFFCQVCYDYGVFKEDDLTVEKVLLQVKGDEHYKKLNSFKKNKITKRINQLDRWNKKKYEAD